MFEAKKEARAGYYQWLGMTELEKKEQGFPLTTQGIGKVLGVAAPTMARWKRKYQLEVVVPVQKVQPVVETVNEFDASAFLRGKKQEVCEKLIERINNGKANARDFELFLKTTGILREDKPKGNDGNINIGQLILRAELQLKQAGMGTYRVVEVQDVPAILHRDVCEDKRQGDDAIDSVQTMGLSEGHSTDDTG